MPRVALVQTAAYLVGGDAVRLRVRVDDGAALELCEISATLVHPGEPARQIIDIEVGDHARLVFAELPLIVAAGARLERRLTITLGAGSQVVHRDTLVLGRHGEAPVTRSCARGSSAPGRRCSTKRFTAAISLAAQRGRPRGCSRDRHARPLRHAGPVPRGRIRAERDRHAHSPSGASNPRAPRD